MTDFGPMLANPRTALLGAAARFGIFIALIGAPLLSEFVPGVRFTLLDAASIGIIGRNDIYLRLRLYFSCRCISSGRGCRDILIRNDGGNLPSLDRGITAVLFDLLEVALYCPILHNIRLCDEIAGGGIS